jgi:hypothetical protein
VEHEEGDEDGVGEYNTSLFPVNKFIDFGAIPYTSAKEGRLQYGV